jgi:hypothetical protein
MTCDANGLIRRPFVATYHQSGFTQKITLAPGVILEGLHLKKRQS